MQALFLPYLCITPTPIPLLRGGLCTQRTGWKIFHLSFLPFILQAPTPIYLKH